MSEQPPLTPGLHIRLVLLKSAEWLPFSLEADPHTQLSIEVTTLLDGEQLMLDVIPVHPMNFSGATMRAINTLVELALVRAHDRLRTLPYQLTIV